MSSLDNIVNMDMLYNSWQKISARNSCSDIDGVDLDLYRSDLQKHLRCLQTSVVSGNYQPYGEKTYESKIRIVSLYCIDDKIIQTAVAKLLNAEYEPAKNVHGFVGKRSIFTAKKSLDKAVARGIYDYAKIDIRKFYNSINKEILLEQIAFALNETSLVDFIKKLILSHNPGLSTGSCLSPVLSNLYLDNFDRVIEQSSEYYARYVDDILVAPVANLALVNENLRSVQLTINEEKSGLVNANKGFRYLGFDIKHNIDKALEKNDFVTAEKLYKAQESDIIVSEPSEETTPLKPKSKPDYEMPNTIRNVVGKCTVIQTIMDKSENENHLNLEEKYVILQVFHCLGKDGEKFIHHILSNCDDYDFAETQRRINRYSVHNPIGCKKLCERIGGFNHCKCNFTNEKIYPTPIIYALRVDRECFIPMTSKDNIGHFKAKNPKDKAQNALTAILELNKKQYEIQEQQKILKGQIEDLFERTNTTEFQTPHGLVIKNDDGIFIKVG